MSGSQINHSFDEPLLFSELIELHHFRLNLNWAENNLWLVSTQIYKLLNQNYF